MMLEALDQKHFDNFNVQIAQKESYNRLTDAHKKVLLTNGRSFAACSEGKTYCIGGWIESNLVTGFDFMVWTYLADNVKSNMTGVLRIVADALGYLTKNNHRAFALTPEDFKSGRRMLELLAFRHEGILNLGGDQTAALYVRP